jgi:hypothetical protein
VLWNQLPGDHQVLPLAPFVLLFLLGTLATVAYIAYRRKGILEDFLLLTSVVLILSPKLHTGYLSMVVLVMAPLLRGRAMALGYFLFGAAAVAADFYKWPVADFRVAFWLMVAALGLLGLLVVRIYGGPDAEVLTGQRAIGRLRPTDLRSHPIDG